nr:MAG TPA: hypothetical protein [Caudoviricetes sp.]
MADLLLFTSSLLRLIRSRKNKILKENSFLSGKNSKNEKSQN